MGQYLWTKFLFTPLPALCPLPFPKKVVEPLNASQWLQLVANSCDLFGAGWVLYSIYSSLFDGDSYERVLIRGFRGNQNTEVEVHKSQNSGLM